MLVGCGGGSGFERLPVYGTVALVGGEKFSGSISFVPEKGTSGPAATVSLIDGVYQFDRRDGPSEGPHRVIVQRVIPKDAALANRKKKNAAPLVKPKVEKESRMDWTLSANVPADGNYQFDFKLDP